MASVKPTAILGISAYYHDSAAALVVDGEMSCSLAIPGFTLRYTTDGSDPTGGSPEVQGPIPA